MLRSVQNPTKAGSARADIYYYAPSGKKLRSRVEIEDYCELEENKLPCIESYPRVLYSMLKRVLVVNIDLLDNNETYLYCTQMKIMKSDEGKEYI